MPTARIVGMGRAGSAFASALPQVGWHVDAHYGRSDDPAASAQGVDLVLICTPDHAIASVAAAVGPGDAVVAHVAGSLGLAVLDSHARRAALHPLMALPNAEIGAERLLDGGWFAVAGDPIVGELVAALGAQSFRIEDQDRAVYHAAACVAANHLVALLGQTERLAEAIGVPPAAYMNLARGAMASAAALGAAEALTGPAARGDDATIARHLAALPDDERQTYECMVREARRLAGRTDATGNEG